MDGHTDKAPTPEADPKRAASHEVVQAPDHPVAMSYRRDGDHVLGTQGTGSGSGLTTWATPMQVLALQRTAGNTAVSRLLGHNASVDRYAVGVAGDADYDTLLGWMETSNPHAPQQALTTAQFNWSGGFRVRAEGDQFRISVPNASVTLRLSVDMPQWASSDAGLQRSWSSMIRRLRAHERQHEAIARRWKRRLRARLRAGILVDKADVDTAISEALDDVNNKWAEWIGEQQDAQDAIDPHIETLHRPPS